MKRIIAIVILLFYFIVITALLIPNNDIQDIKMTNDENLNQDFLHINQITTTINFQTHLLFKTGWLNDNTNIREYPDLKSNIYETFLFGREVLFSQYNAEWCIIKYKDKVAYVNSELISDIPLKLQEYDVEDRSIKSFMSYESISSKSSNQYQLQQNAYTGEYGIRKIHNRYCIALGSYFTTETGTYIDLILQNGIIVPCILADCKSDIDTDNLHMKTMHDQSLVEFIVDTKNIDSYVLKTGDISNSCAEWNSPIIKIKIYDKKENH